MRVTIVNLSPNQVSVLDHILHVGAALIGLLWQMKPGRLPDYQMFAMLCLEKVSFKIDMVSA